MDTIFKGSIKKREQFWRIEILELQYAAQNESLVLCLNQLREYLCQKFEKTDTACSVEFSDGGVVQVKVSSTT